MPSSGSWYWSPIEVKDRQLSGKSGQCIEIVCPRRVSYPWRVLTLLMNTRLRFQPLHASLLGSAGSVLFCIVQGHAALIAGWDFQGTTEPGGPIGTMISMPPTTHGDFSANAGVYQSTSHLYFNGTHGSSDFFVGTANADTALGSLKGITANTAGTNFSQATGAPNGGSLALFSRVELGGLNGKSAVFQLSMDGYQALEFSFAVQRPTNTNGNGMV